MAFRKQQVPSETFFQVILTMESKYDQLYWIVRWRWQCQVWQSHGDNSTILSVQKKTVGMAGKPSHKCCLSDHHTNAVYLDGKVSEVNGFKKSYTQSTYYACFAFPPSNQSCTCGSVLFCQAGSKHLAKTTCYSCFKEVADVIEP